MPIVYTAIINGKDELPPAIPEKGWRHICFSDVEFKHPVWEFMPIVKNGQQDARRIARRYKVLSHILFPGEDTIWTDGRVRLLRNPGWYLDKYNGDIVIRQHLTRNCLYKEAAEVVRINYEDPRIVNLQMKRYMQLGYPQLNGLWETGCIIRRATKSVEAFNNAWWAEISMGSKRDQLSVNFVSWWLNIPIQSMNRSDIQVAKHRVKTNVDR